MIGTVLLVSTLLFALAAAFCDTQGKTRQAAVAAYLAGIAAIGAAAHYLSPFSETTSVLPMSSATRPSTCLYSINFLHFGRDSRDRSFSGSRSMLASGFCSCAVGA